MIVFLVQNHIYVEYNFGCFVVLFFLAFLHTFFVGFKDKIEKLGYHSEKSHKNLKLDNLPKTKVTTLHK